MQFGGADTQSGESALGRYHFDLENDHEVVRDLEGVAASSLEEAIVQALDVIVEMRDADDLVEPGAWTLVVRDADGTTVERLTVE